MFNNNILRELFFLNFTLDIGSHDKVCDRYVGYNVIWCMQRSYGPDKLVALHTKNNC